MQAAGLAFRWRWFPLTDCPNIAFVGKAGAGKTTCAEILAAQGYSRLSFAAPLKEIAVRIWGVDALLDRGKLQYLGNAVRQYDEDAWVNAAVRDLGDEKVGPAYLPWVVDDCRFPNEYWALKKRGFVIVRVWAPRNVRVARLRANGKLQDESQLEHVSETALDGEEFKPDYQVVNSEGMSHAALQISLENVLYREAARV